MTFVFFCIFVQQRYLHLFSWSNWFQCIANLFTCCHSRGITAMQFISTFLLNNTKPGAMCEKTGIFKPLHIKLKCRSFFRSNFFFSIWHATIVFGRASERKFFRGTKVNTGPPSSIGVAKGGPGGPGPPIEMLPKIKMSQKRLLFLQFQFYLASSRTTVHAYNSN